MPSWLLPAAPRVLGKWSPLKGSWELFSCQAPWNVSRFKLNCTRTINLDWSQVSGNETCEVMQVVYFYDSAVRQKYLQCCAKIHFLIGSLKNSLNSRKSEIIWKECWKTTQAQLTADQCHKLQVNGVRKGADLVYPRAAQGSVFVWVWQREKVRGLDAWGDRWHSMTSCKSTVWILVWQTAPLKETDGWIWECHHCPPVDSPHTSARPSTLSFSTCFLTGFSPFFS